MAGKHRAKKDDDEYPVNEEQAKKEAIELEQKAQELLDKAHARTEKIDSLTTALRKIRERNHLGELIYNAMIGRS